MNIQFDTTTGLVPAIIQDDRSQEVLMLGYMNKEALEKTQSENRVTFFSRSKKRLWTKGETSDNFLEVVSITSDCDSDTLLIRAIPAGPVCHTGTDTCFGDSRTQGFLHKLEVTIAARKAAPLSGSYTTELLSKGINKIAQKVGEEAVELIIEAKDDNRDLFLNEAADLMYHFLVLLQAKDCSLGHVEEILAGRTKKVS
jgi:phosphoribosyl-ATP pyrophosphohydrolase/phosphoribosyl-AMP cyclohydrolase